MTLSGFTIQNAEGADGIRILNYSGPTITDNVIAGNDNIGINGEVCEGVTIISNTIENNGLKGVEIKGVATYGLIANNIIRDNLDDGIAIFGENYEIHNNIIYDNSSEGIEINASSSAIFNNAIDGNNNGLLCNGSDQSTIKNNIISNSVDGYGIIAINTAVIDINYNNIYNNSANYIGVLPDVGNISENPQFSGIPGNEYYLLGSSPCIDAGDPADPVPEGGGDRIDMGALEYTGLMLDFSLISPYDNEVI